ncbi:hypothetical protein M407DRAFT_102191 [Tulasnella calospora MUT 4182]|uniref:Uncharacterized protein n=1 Tax=Tulasnella calospora MUT 4182 TaxID=1051891 RepID=A0A0C3KSD6_9AGAM|nr:hypothetical protein M407DRAFT_102191 [Tulasnella calospora MUT 4182]
MPAPAAAPSFSGTAGPLPAPAFQQSGFLIGRIRCIPSDGLPSTYISRYLDAHNGLLLRTQDPMHSLQVRWNPSSLPTSTLGTVNCRSSYQFLGGVTRNNNPQFLPGCSESLSITTTTGPTSSTRAHSRIYKGRPISGLPFANIWNIIHDGTVVATLRVDDTSYALTSMITLKSNSVSLALCPRAYLASRSPGDRVEVRLVFEPI